jgi:hypothetical protein
MRIAFLLAAALTSVTFATPLFDQKKLPTLAPR